MCRILIEIVPIYTLRYVWVCSGLCSSMVGVHGNFHTYTFGGLSRASKYLCVSRKLLQVRENSFTAVTELLQLLDVYGLHWN